MQSPGESGSRPRRVLARTAQLGLTVLVTWFIVERLGPGLSELADAEGLGPPRWGWLAASCLVLAGGYAASGWIWGRMVRDLGGPRLSAGRAVRIYLVANLGRYVPGKLWQIAGLALLARRAGVSPAVATAAAVVGQAVGLAAATLIGALSVLRSDAGVSASLVWSVLGGATIVVAALAIPALFRPLVRLWLRVAARRSPDDATVGTLEGLRWLTLYTLNWAAYALAFWLLVRGLSLQGDLFVVGPAFAAAYVFGYAALFAPAGLGVREASLIVLLAPTLGPAGAALAATAGRVWSTVVEVIPAGAFWLAGMRAETIGAEAGEGG